MSFAICCFIALNVPLGLIGLALFAVGTLLGLFDLVIQPLIQPLLQSLPLPSGVSTNLGTLLTGPSIAFTMIGAVFCVLSVMTCMAFCGKKKTTSVCFVVVYDIVIGLLLLLTLALIIIGSSAQAIIGASFSSFVYSTLKNTYVSVDSTDAINVMWNVAQMGLQCCGVSSGGDYSQAAAFNTSWLTMQDPSNSGSTLKMVIPPSCCTSAFLSNASSFYSKTSTSSSSTSGASMKSAQLMSSCVFYYTDQASNYKYGCMNAFWVQFEVYKWYIIGPAISILMILLFLFIVPIVVVYGNRRSAANQTNKWESREKSMEMAKPVMQEKPLTAAHPQLSPPTTAYRHQQQASPNGNYYQHQAPPPSGYYQQQAPPASGYYQQQAPPTATYTTTSPQQQQQQQQQQEQPLTARRVDLRGGGLY